MTLPLAMMLRPPGCGLHSPSLGTNPLAKGLLRRMYDDKGQDEINAIWAASLNSIATARILVLGVPSDTGAGGRRGAAYGPIGVREALYGGSPIAGLVDVGDICCIPHLLHDEILNDAQLMASREALYGDAAAPYPVSPLSMTLAVCRELRRLAPAAFILSIGGDHSIAACSIDGVVPEGTENWGLLHFDAHDDLSNSRFGVALTYGSWLPYLEKRRTLQAVLQVGLNDLQPKAGRANVEQLRASDLHHRAGVDCANEILNWFFARGVRQIYVTLDVDVTDGQQAPAVALPSDGGLRSEQVVEILQIVRKNITVLGADIVEVAPILSPILSWSEEPTCQVAAVYARAILGAEAL